MSSPYSVEKRPLYEQVAEMLRLYIVENGLKPGDKLPLEDELASIFDVGRSSVREAVRALSALGVLDVQRRKGTYIQAVSPDEFIENLAYGLYFSQDAVDNLFEVRSTLELGLLARIWRNESALEKLTVLLRERLRKLEETSPDADAFIAADIAFHQAFFECADNDTIAKLASVVDEFMLRSRAESHVPERRERVLHEHRLVIEAIEDRDLVLAQQRLLDHFLWYRASSLSVKCPEEASDEKQTHQS